jgi:Uma2 family endonuclease
LNFLPVIDMTEEQFFTFCQVNRDLRIEQTAAGKVIVMPPAGGESGARNLRTSRYLDEWAERDGTGIAFDSSTGYRLPDGALLSPDGSWVLRSRWSALAPEQRRRFLPLCPDFVLELLSPTDSLAATQAKMGQWMGNGAQLGWLIDPDARRVYVYRPGDPAPETLDAPATVSGDPILPSFVLDMARIWDPNA